MSTLILPSLPKAERAVLGTILIDSEDAPRIVAQLDDGDFYEIKHREIFSALASRIRRGEAADLVTMSSKGGFDPAALASYIDEVATTANWPYYVRLLHDYRSRREVIEGARKAAMAAGNTDIPLQDAIRAAMDSLSKASRSSDASPMPDVVLRRYVERISKWPGVPLSSGIDGLDSLMGGGLYPGEVLAIIGGDGSMKTSLALAYVRNWLSSEGANVLYLSLDMTPERLALRRLLPFAGMNEKTLTRAIRRHDPTVEEALNELEESDGGRFRVEGGPMSLAAIERAVAQCSPGLVVWDYLTATDGFDSELAAQRACTEALRSWQNRYRSTTWVILSQMSEVAKAGQRNGEYAGRASGGNSLSRIADAQIELYMDAPPADAGGPTPTSPAPSSAPSPASSSAKPLLVAIITKNRSGPKGAELALDYDGPTMTFTGRSSRVERPKKRKPVFTTRW